MNLDDSTSCSEIPPRVILSFDVEEHHRIEAAAGLKISMHLKRRYAERVGPTTRWLLEQLEAKGLPATFFIVGELARDQPQLVREIHRKGHEIASHGWDHRRVQTMTPEEFREDLRRSVDILQQITGVAVAGYRAPTFSITRQNPWAIDLMAEAGLRYDSSIYPVYHDRYGVPDAPRSPFMARGPGGGQVLELPPATLRVGGMNVPVGGGGYFRLLPLSLLMRGVQQVTRIKGFAVATLYFHPWEFDSIQPRLPLNSLKRFRTYVGIHRNQRRFLDLLSRNVSFTRAIDMVSLLQSPAFKVSQFSLGEQENLEIHTRSAKHFTG